METKVDHNEEKANVQSRTLREIRDLELNKLLASRLGLGLATNQIQNIRHLIAKIENTGFVRMFTDDKGGVHDLYKMIIAEVKKGNPEFKLFTKCGPNRLNASSTLYFKFGEKTGNYYWNSYIMEIKPRGYKEAIFNKFNINVYSNEGVSPVPGVGRNYLRNRNVTASEALNLLEGRSVCKEQPNDQMVAKENWIALGYRNGTPSSMAPIVVFDPEKGFDFDLTETLRAMPIKDIDKLVLDLTFMDSIKKGNPREVVVLIGGEEWETSIGVSAKDKTIRFYDRDSKQLIQGANYQQLAAQMLIDRISGGLTKLENPVDGTELHAVTFEQMGSIAVGKSICQVHQAADGTDRELWLSLNTPSTQPFGAEQIVVWDATASKFNPEEQLSRLPIANQEEIAGLATSLRAGNDAWINLYSNGKSFRLNIQVNALEKDFRMLFPSGRMLSETEKQHLRDHTGGETAKMNSEVSPARTGDRIFESYEKALSDKLIAEKPSSKNLSKGGAKKAESPVEKNDKPRSKKVSDTQNSDKPGKKKIKVSM